MKKDKLASRERFSLSGFFCLKKSMMNKMFFIGLFYHIPSIAIKTE